jgi:hypothetical protein
MSTVFHHNPSIMAHIKPEQGELWIDCFAPMTSDELVVHKKKVSQVRDWLIEALAGRGQVSVHILNIYLFLI